MKKNGNVQLAICLDNDDYPVSLEIGKLYRVIEDQEASQSGYLRIVDESGEDYAFAASRFHLINLPNSVTKSLISRLQPA